MGQWAASLQVRGAPNCVWSKDEKIALLLNRSMILDEDPERENICVRLQQCVNELCMWCYSCLRDQLFCYCEVLIGPGDFRCQTVPLNKVCFSERI